MSARVGARVDAGLSKPVKPRAFHKTDSCRLLMMLIGFGHAAMMALHSVQCDRKLEAALTIDDVKKITFIIETL